MFPTLSLSTHPTIKIMLYCDVHNMEAPEVGRYKCMQLFRLALGQLHFCPFQSYFIKDIFSCVDIEIGTDVDVNFVVDVDKDFDVSIMFISVMVLLLMLVLGLSLC